MSNSTIPVRITKRRYRELRRLAKANGHTIAWLMNYALDLYFQSLEPQPARTKDGGMPSNGPQAVVVEETVQP
jgi:hypothetical protein